MTLIRETIVTTLDAQGNPHHAPLGVHVLPDWLVLAPFRPSRTLDHLRQGGAAVINYCDDVRIFAGALTGRRDWPTVPCEAIAGRRLRDALAHAEVVVESCSEDVERPRFRCRVVHEASHLPFQGFNRAQFAVIEAAILLSRVDRLPAEKIDQELAYLRIGLEKTAGPREEEAWNWLMQAFLERRGNPITESPSP